MNDRYGIGLIGGRGYAGEALLRLIATHPRLELCYAASRSLEEKRIADVYTDLPLAGSFVAKRPGEDLTADIIVLALANGEAAAFVEAIPPSQAVVDLSADYRLQGDWHYGLPELGIAPTGRRIANPGCYATAAMLGLAPIAEHIEPFASVFGVSGFSGAGRRPAARNNPDRLAANLLPYGFDQHNHQMEVSHRLGRPIRFAPHVAGFFRGLMVTITATMREETNAAALIERYRSFFDQTLVEVRAEPAEIAMVAETPNAVIGGFTVDRRSARHITLCCALDNLLKGAASQAIQNINALLDLPDTMGLA